MSHISLAQELINTDTYTSTDLVFIHNEKFVPELMQEYLLGFKSIKGNHHTMFMRTLLKIYTYDRNTTDNRIIIQIDKLIHNYEPFKKIYDNYTVYTITRNNIHDITFRIDKLCQGDIFIYGKCVSHILNNQCNDIDFELFTMVYSDSIKYQKFLDRLGNAFKIIKSSTNLYDMILIAGIPRMLIIVKSDCDIRTFIQRLSVQNHIYLNSYCTASVTTQYNINDQSQYYIDDYKNSPLYQFLYNHYKNTKNLTTKECYSDDFIKCVNTYDLMKWFTVDSIQPFEHY
jgi:hypothetical protein